MDHFDRIAPVYDRIVPLPVSERILSLLHLPSPGWILDAGGGTGRVSRRLSHDPSRLVLCDLSIAMLRQARRKSAATFMQARAEALPFRDGAFARIVVADAFHHFVSQEDALDELARVLAPGGRLVMEEPDIHRPWIRALSWSEKAIGMHSRILPGETVAMWMGQRGLATDLVRDGRFLVWIVGEKPPVPGG